MTIVVLEIKHASHLVFERDDILDNVDNTLVVTNAMRANKQTNETKF